MGKHHLIDTPDCANLLVGKYMSDWARNLSSALKHCIWTLQHVDVVIHAYTHTYRHNDIQRS